MQSQLHQYPALYQRHPAPAGVAVQMALAYIPELAALPLPQRRAAQSLAVRELARWLLSQCNRAVAPAAWKLSGGGQQALQVVAPKPMFISVSHRDGWLACAVSETLQVGVDIECHPAPSLADEQSWPLYLQGQEQSELAHYSASQRSLQALQLWCRKEAWLKASHHAHAIGMAQVLVQPDGSVAAMPASGSHPAIPSLSTAVWPISANALSGGMTGAMPPSPISDISAVLALAWG